MNTKAFCMRVSFAATAFSLMVAAPVWSAPMAHDKKLPPGDVLCLARINVVHLDIKPMPASLVDLEITAESVREKWTQMLATVGIRVVDDDADETAPLLTLSAATGVDAEVSSEAVLSLMRLTLRQSARFDRLDRSIAVSTYVRTIADITLKDGLKAVMTTNLRTLIDNIVTDVRRANAWWDKASKVEGPSAEGTAPRKESKTGD